jgi:hypothetical protein
VNKMTCLGTLTHDRPRSVQYQNSATVRCGQYSVYCIETLPLSYDILPLAKLGSEFLPQAFTLRVLPYSARVSKHIVVVKCSSLL